MSRIGKKPIPVPENVKMKMAPGCITFTSPSGTLEQRFPVSVLVEFDEKNKVLLVKKSDDQKQSRAYHGLVRALLNNCVTGITKGFQKNLEIIGTGFNAKLKGKHLELQIGFCLPYSVMIPEGLTVELPTPLKMIIKGIDKQKVGQFAANIRQIRMPDNYKGKGIRYEGEKVKIKESKTFAGAGSGK
jgi:large subunit ribosomal protein L6